MPVAQRPPEVHKRHRRRLPPRDEERMVAMGDPEELGGVQWVHRQKYIAYLVQWEDFTPAEARLAWADEFFSAFKANYRNTWGPHNMVWIYMAWPPMPNNLPHLYDHALRWRKWHAPRDHPLALQQATRVWMSNDPADSV